jgi:site-specific recombinase XerD
MPRRRASDELFRLVELFFRDHLQRARAVSRNTVLAYRDAIRLFLSFLADKSGRAVADLRIGDQLSGLHFFAVLPGFWSTHPSTIVRSMMVASSS